MSDRVEAVISSVEGGVAKDIDDIVRSELGLEMEELSREERDEIDQELFTCEACGWTMPRGDSESEQEPGICDECLTDSEADDDA